MVNTCGFVEAAKKDSIDTLLAAADLKGRPAKAVVAVGCLAERYGDQLADALPEADAVLGFDDYAEIAARLRRRARRQPLAAAQSRATAAPCCRSRRCERAGAPGPRCPGTGAAARPAGRIAPASGPRPLRRRLGGGPVAPLKLASGCDRRCTFCAIPSFRGAFVSRARRRAARRGRAGWPGRASASWSWSARTPPPTARTSATCGCWRRCCRELAAVEGIERVRVSYLQPAETAARR